MDHVVPHHESVVASNRAGRGLQRVCCTDHLARRIDRLVALEHERDEGPRGDELEQPVVERLAGVLLVVALGQLARHRQLIERREP